MNILINSANVVASGAVAVVSNLLPHLFQEMETDTFFVLVPDIPIFRNLSWATNSFPIFRPRFGGKINDLWRFYDLLLAIPKQANRLRADICLTLGDIGPVNMHCPHIVFLHQPLLVYDQQEYLRNISYWNPLKQRYLAYYLSKSVKKVAKVVVQTPVMKKRLATQYPASRNKIMEISQPIPQHILKNTLSSSRYPSIEKIDKPIKLLFLAAYYPHKNHASLPAVVTEIRKRNLSSKVHIFTTIPPEKATRLNLEYYSDVISNLGILPSEKVASALKSATALFLPTLVESYGLIYLEAMAMERLILTSDRDFAQWMCRDLAIYFDPLDAFSIVSAIEKTLEFDNSPVYKNKLKQRLADFPENWQFVATQFSSVLREVYFEK